MLKAFAVEVSRRPTLSRLRVASGHRFDSGNFAIGGQLKWGHNMDRLTRLPHADAAATSYVPALPHPARQAISDGVITAKVRASLLANTITSRHGIQVETFSAIVRLSGYVESEAVRIEAMQIAADVEGVQLAKDFMDVHHS